MENQSASLNPWWALEPKLNNLTGGLTVRRLLPSLRLRAVGPFVFFDHFGPVDLAADADSDVPPHPHIGLATVTYLFEGGFLHRDSLGTLQPIEPGAVNWMVAGRGVVHSERRLGEQLNQSRRLHGLQLWVGLGRQDEQGEPSFQHVPAKEIPQLQWPSSRAPGAYLRLLVGSALGERSPVHTSTSTLYIHGQLAPQASLELPNLAQEQAVYSPLTGLQLSGRELPACHLAILPRGGALSIRNPTQGSADFVLIGGEPLGRRHLWWNFVASDKALLAAAAARWRAQAFPMVPGESEFVPGPTYRA
jgi:hypothetical protein